MQIVQSRASLSSQYIAWTASRGQFRQGRVGHRVSRSRRHRRRRQRQVAPEVGGVRGDVHGPRGVVDGLDDGGLARGNGVGSGNGVAGGRGGQDGERHVGATRGNHSAATGFLKSDA